MIVEQINGVNRSFLLGTKTFIYIHELTGVSKIDEVFERLINKRKRKGANGGEVFENEPIECEIKHIDFISKFFFCLAKTGAQLNGEAVDFNEGTTSHWMDLIGFEKATGIINHCIEAYNDVNQKNALAPMTGLRNTA